jgi:hypothetical protein
MEKINKAVRSAGFIRSMKTYTLINKPEGLYLIHVGPAIREQNYGLMTPLVVSPMRKSYNKKIEAGEARIQNTSLQELIKDKHSFFLSKGEITDVTFKQGLQFPTLKVKTADKKFTFTFPYTPIEEVQPFVDGLK